MGFLLIHEKIMNINYTSDILCKVTHFIMMWVGTIALLLLWIISIDRYRKICRPFGSQIAVSSIKYIGFGIVIFTCLCSSRLLATYKIVMVNVTVLNVNATIQTFYCSSDSEDGIFKQIGLVFYLIDFVMCMIVLVTLIVTYSKIIYTLYRRRKSMNKWRMAKTNNCKDDDMKHNSLKINVIRIGSKNVFLNAETDIKSIERDNIESKAKQQDMSTKSETIHVPSTKKECPNFENEASGMQSSKRNFEFSTAKKPSEWKLTMMMFTFSVSLILCTIPYLYIRIIIRLVLKTDVEYNFDSAIQLILMLPFFNNAFNPMIQFIFNTEFRQYIRSFFI
jgi:hypothetical protein